MKINTDHVVVPQQLGEEAMNAQLEKERWFENELRDLVKQCHEGMNVSDIMFQVLKERVIEEWRTGQYIAWLDWQHEMRKQDRVEQNEHDLPW